MTAETVVVALEDIRDYRAFEAAVIADYDARTAVERELVLRLASLLWRIRRATAIETDLLQIQVGYVYNEIGCDSGSGDRVGCFQSRVIIGVGPQVGFVIPMGATQGYLNFKGYKEFDNANRPDGWNAWVTFSLSPAAPSRSTPRRMQ